MSGIIAVYNRNERLVESEVLHAMLDRMQHRGPDRRSVWHHGHAGLGHCLLITTPEARNENQPCFDETGGVAITADARIDNRPELLQQFGYNMGDAQGIPDSRLIVQAYLKWGDRCVDYLLGDFAVALIDQRQNRLFCFRDHLGLKSLYYYLANDLCVVASDVNAILAYPDVPKTINEGRIADYFVSQLEGINKTETFYRDIYRLPPAHMLHVGHATSRVDEYWSPSAARSVYFRNERDYVEGFDEKLREAVAARLRSHSEPAVLLSGGIDSSAILSVANALRVAGKQTSLRSISALSEGNSDCIESRFIRRVNQYAGGELLSLTTGDLPEYGNDLTALFRKLGEPFDHMTLILLLYILASRNNHRVLLDGVEGDMVHSLSWSYPATLLRRLQFIRAFREINGVWKNCHVRQTSKLKLHYGYIRQALVPNSLRRWRYQHSRTTLKKLTLPGTIINPDFADSIHINNRLQEFQQQGHYGPASDLRQQHIDSILHGYLPAALERYDRVAALCGVEARHPLLDKRLVEYSVGMPWQWKTRDGWSKYILRRVTALHLPEEVAWRRGREHLGWSFTSAWMKLHNDEIRDTVARCLPVLERYINTPLLQKILRKNNDINGHPDEGLVWEVYQFASWYERQ